MKLDYSHKDTSIRISMLPETDGEKDLETLSIHATAPKGNFGNVFQAIGSVVPSIAFPLPLATKPPDILRSFEVELDDLASRYPEYERSDFKHAFDLFLDEHE